jgi:hypothetical protein
MKLQTQIINLTIIAILGLQVSPILTVQAIDTETVEKCSWYCISCCGRSYLE